MAAFLIDKNLTFFSNVLQGAYSHFNILRIKQVLSIIKLKLHSQKLNKRLINVVLFLINFKRKKNTFIHCNTTYIIITLYPSTVAIAVLQLKHVIEWISWFVEHLITIQSYCFFTVVFDCIKM